MIWCKHNKEAGMHTEKIIEIIYKGGLYKIRKDTLLYILKTIRNEDNKIIEREFNKAYAKEEKSNKEKLQESIAMVDFLKMFRLNDDSFLEILEKVSLRSLSKRNRKV